MKVGSVCIILAALALFLMPSIAASEDLPGTAYSRPNASGGFDFYDSEGNKLGSSSRNHEGDYVYYNTSGSMLGTLKFDREKGKYEFLDGSNIRMGELTKGSYGGYRYKKIKSEEETSLQLGIRKDYEYANPYGSGIETLPLDIIRGEKSASNKTVIDAGLDTSTGSRGLGSSSSSLETTGNNVLQTTPLKKSGLSTES